MRILLRARCARVALEAVLALTALLATVPPAHAQPPRASTPNPYDPTQEIRVGNAAAFRNLIPPSMLEEQASEEYAQLIRAAQQRNALLPDSDPQVKRVRAILQKLIPYSLKWNERAKQWHWEANVVRSPNVMVRCLPGGKIVVDTGLFTRLRPNDDELAMLLGHMIAHALREHARERLSRQQATQLGVGTIPQLFGLADLGAAPLGIGSQLIDMRYDAADETEADVIGNEIASRAGFDPRGAVTVWSRAASLPGAAKSSFVATNPMSPQRAHDIRKRLSDMLPLYAKSIGKTVDTLPR
jgi:predicted Zn-dependent protease